MMKPRATAVALILSAALNLFLISAGLVLVTRGVHIAAQAAIQRPVLKRAAATLEPAHRDGFLRLLRIEGKTARGSSRQARGLRVRAWGSLAAGNFDVTSAKADLAQARILNQDSRGKIEDAVIDFAAALPPDERAKLGAAMRRAILAQGPVTGPPQPSRSPTR